MNGFEKRRRQTMERVLEFIRNKGGVCTDPTFQASGDKIQVRCSKNHEWTVSPYKLLEGDWCFTCARETAALRKREDTFKRFCDSVAGWGGLVEASSYDYGGQLLPVHCSRGHRTLMDPVDVLYRSSRCPECLKAEREEERATKLVSRSVVTEQKEKARREKFLLAIEAHGGSLVPGRPESDRSRTWVRCEKHAIDLLVRNDRIMSGQWCSQCGIETRAKDRRQATFQKAQQYAACKGGRVVSDCYPMGADTLEWECANGHRWNASPLSVLNGGTWCPEEADRSPKTMTVAERQDLSTKSRRAHSLEIARQRATARGGECLTQTYLRSEDGMVFRCARGHQFTMLYRDTKTHWCPDCARTRSSRGERLSRAILEQLLGFSLKSARPHWLVSSKNRGLSLDMYNADHKLAIEYQGDGVHSGFRESSWYSDHIKFLRTVEIDREKEAGCRANGVLLIPIPGFRETVGLSEIIKVLKGLLRANNVAFRENTDINIKHDELFTDDLLERVNNVLSAKGGTLVSPVIPGMLHPIEVRCTQHGVTWSTTASRLIHRGRWCLVCSKERHRTVRRTSKLVNPPEDTISTT